MSNSTGQVLHVVGVLVILALSNFMSLVFRLVVGIPIGMLYRLRFDPPGTRTIARTPGRQALRREASNPGQDVQDADGHRRPGSDEE